MITHCDAKCFLNRVVTSSVGDLHGRDGPDSVGGLETLGLPVREPSGEN